MKEGILQHEDADFKRRDIAKVVVDDATRQAGMITVTWLQFTDIGMSMMKEDGFRSCIELFSKGFRYDIYIPATGATFKGCVFGSYQSRGPLGLDQPFVGAANVYFVEAV